MDGIEHARALIDEIRKRVKTNPEAAIILLNRLEDSLASILQSFKDFLKLTEPMSEILRRAEEIVRKDNIAEAVKEAEDREKH